MGRWLFIAGLASLSAAACFSFDGLTGGVKLDAGLGDGATNDGGPDSTDGSATDGGEVGCPGCTEVASGEQTPTDLLRDDNGRLVWIRGGAGGAIARVDPQTAGPPESVQAVASARDLVLVESYYFVLQGDDYLKRANNLSTCGQRMGLRLGGSGSKLVVADGTSFFTMPASTCADAPTVILSQQALAVAADPPVVWWTTSTGAIARCDGLPGNCAATSFVLADGQGGDVDILAIDGSRVYWVVPGTSTEIRTKLKTQATADAPAVVASMQRNPKTLAPAGSDLYWTNLEGGTVMKAPAAGGGPVTTVASGLDRPWGLVVTASELFVTESGAGRVLRIPR